MESVKIEKTKDTKEDFLFSANSFSACIFRTNRKIKQIYLYNNKKKNEIIRDYPKNSTDKNATVWKIRELRDICNALLKEIAN